MKNLSPNPIAQPTNATDLRSPCKASRYMDVVTSENFRQIFNARNATALTVVDKLSLQPVKSTLVNEHSISHQTCYCTKLRKNIFTLYTSNNFWDLQNLSEAAIMNRQIIAKTTPFENIQRQTGRRTLHKEISWSLKSALAPPWARIYSNQSTCSLPHLKRTTKRERLLLLRSLQF